VDFRGDPVGAKDSVNEWVSGQTQDKINDLIRSVRPDTLLVLVNAVYFKGKWNNPFNPEATKDDLFYPVPRSPGVKVPFMWKSSSFNYFQAKGAQIVELFYGEERAFSLALILPKDAPGALKSLEKKLDQALWESWRQGLKPQRLVLGLPKFKITWESPSLVGPLRELGMELPFGDAADFGGIAEAANLKITDVIQKAFIQVEEEGAEAAAATGSGGLIAMAGPPEPKPPLVLVNRPFLFLIKDNQTQSVLFMGRLNDPS
jgi:serpin B